MGSPKWVRIFSMAVRSIIAAMILTSPRQNWHWVTSILKTRLRSFAQEMRDSDFSFFVEPSAAVSVWSFGFPRTILCLAFECGANSP